MDDLPECSETENNRDAADSHDKGSYDNGDSQTTELAFETLEDQTASAISTSDDSVGCYCFTCYLYY
jgi:hypothetical protein